MGGWPATGRFVHLDAVPSREIHVLTPSGIKRCISASGGGREMHVIPPSDRTRRSSRWRAASTARSPLRSFGARGSGRAPSPGRVERGWLRRIHKGVYLVGALETELTAPAAALLAVGAGAISHRTAAAIWGLLPTRPADPIHVTLLNANRRSRPGLTIHHHELPANEIRRRHGLRLTSPRADPRDLATSSPNELERAYNEALVLNLVTHQEVRVLAARSPRSTRPHRGQPRHDPLAHGARPPRSHQAGRPARAAEQRQGRRPRGRHVLARPQAGRRIRRLEHAFEPHARSSPTASRTPSYSSPASA